MRRAELVAIRRARGERGRRDGRAAEWLAAAWLLLRGWRVIGMRVRTPGAEIDLLAARRGVLAVVEVKRRRTMAEALDAVSPAQARRLRAAGASLAARRPDLAGHAVRLDLVALAPGRWPRHVEGLDL